MTEWTDGYVSDIGYTYGYYSELNPRSVTIPFLMAGLAAPKFTHACELGFGQGVSINAHAAGSDTAWSGTDFNPAHVNFAQGLASASGADVHLVDEAFAEFCMRDDLPDFDFIGLHGIWSWVSHDNRQVLVDFVRRKLKVGGVLYISYNTLPGWSAAAPIRHMLSEHAHTMGSRGEGSVQRVKNSVAFTKQLLSMCHAYQQQVPSIAQRIDTIAEQNPHYLAHEYFNRDWHPMYFADMAECLSDAKLTYACSANFLDDFHLSAYTEAQRAFLAGIPDPLFTESAKDFLINRQFRKDYWVKGARRLSAVEHEQTWRELKFLLITPPDDVKLSIRGTAGEVSLIERIYKPIIGALSNQRVMGVDKILTALANTDITQTLLYEALAMLHAKGDIVLAQPNAQVQAALPKCQGLNKHILKQSLVSNDITHLVSPLMGGAVSYSRINQLFLYAYTQNETNPDQWARAAWQALEKQGHRVIKDGKTLESEADNMAELKRLAEEFAKSGLLIAKALKVVG